ncbi:hypothetical protein FRACYDRAFT_235806 [Fragilariopsis cylindrus CCMP1102]|uniref:UBA domain-containing protein n=1 Tax=Fragilariopsis cylindrus CCMP1102 TaxID=635003 RepID=A0A1E7FNL0_9STRA|nr:hypothetical protein FRACYDRAFT_235806 [Fragilariopsis cylindrus CCMP1102]|eukprot:OEU19750.1 hypothetical protein FRACYDRAFT_235806 [Fragilariopsis cylindrus CCMP1102]
MATIRDEDVDQLVCMGFPNIEVRNALQITAGNLENAINHLLSGGGGGGGGSVGGGGLVPTRQHTAPPNNIDNNNNNISGNNSGVRAVVEGTTSQYTYSSDGRSACTCIALTVAGMILNNDTTTTTSNNRSEDDTNNNDIITADFLDSAIAEGVSRYRRLVTSSSSSGSEIEHLSAEEVLHKDNEQARTKDNRALSIDINHAQGMKACLEGLVRDIRPSGNSNSSDRMICVLLTKTPETVLLCMPTTEDVVDDTTTTTTSQKYYWLIDSHPRPQLLPGVETCYAKSHLTMDSLLQSLRDVFPFTDLGPDVPPMMADMYNMYDLYPLEGRRRR